MSDFEIHKNIENSSTERPEELSNAQRKKFNDTFKEELEIFNELNSLIEEKIGIQTPASTDTTHTQSEQAMDIQHSYNNKAQQLKQELDRLGIIKSDPTGKSQKAAGID